MYELPLDAKVTGTDGRLGTSVAVTLNQESRIISSLVVDDGLGYQRLVPLGNVTKTSHDEIWLECSEEGFKDIPLFQVTEFVERAPQQSGEWADEEGEWEDGIDLSAFERSDDAFGMPVVVERVPEGEVAFHRSTEIEATDGYAGKVEKFVIEADSGAITHIVLKKGHLWGKKEIMIPLTAVDSIDHESVYLNVDKKAVADFPTLKK